MNSSEWIQEKGGCPSFRHRLLSFSFECSVMVMLVVLVCCVMFDGGECEK